MVIAIIIACVIVGVIVGRAAAAYLSL